MPIGTTALKPIEAKGLHQKGKELLGPFVGNPMQMPPIAAGLALLHQSGDPPPANHV